MEVHTLNQEKIPKLTAELTEQLKKEGWFFFCRKVGHITKTCPKKAALLVKPKKMRRDEALQLTPISIFILAHHRRIGYL